MDLNPRHPGTYIGQDARLYVAVETSKGRLLYALRTQGAVIATAWDSAQALRRYAAEKYLRLAVDCD